VLQLNLCILHHLYLDVFAVKHFEIFGPTEVESFQKENITTSESNLDPNYAHVLPIDIKRPSCEHRLRSRLWAH
jgi:hypothetical protein